MSRRLISNDNRTMAQKQVHYGIEKEMADRLRNSTREERRLLYAEVYDELYRRLPDHPLLIRPASREDTQRAVAAQMRNLRPFLNPETTFLEVGAGDCALSAQVALVAKQVYGVEISETVSGHTEMPSNLRLVISDGTSIPVPEDSVDVAFSNHVMEHLHVEDAREQLRNIWATLVPGGIYYCVTPNRLNGPHDISAYFDTTATGLHMKEYSIGELSALFREVGFSRVRARAEIRGTSFEVAVPLIVAFERVIDQLPHAWTRAIAGMPLVRKILGVQLIGKK